MSFFKPHNSCVKQIKPVKILVNTTHHLHQVINLLLCITSFQNCSSRDCWLHTNLGASGPELGCARQFTFLSYRNGCEKSEKVLLRNIFSNISLKVSGDRFQFIFHYFGI